MIRIFAANATDFTTLGVGALPHATCEVSEALNKEYEVELSCPYDDEGRWRIIEAERIIVAPVPVAPNISWEYAATHTGIYETTAACKLWSAAAGENRAIAQVTVGRKGVRLGTGSAAMYEFCLDDGMHGWIDAANVRLIDTRADAIESTVHAPQWRDQPFRIERIDYKDDSIVAKARHISYDLSWALIRNYKPENKTCAAVMLELATYTLDAHPFNLRSPMTSANKSAEFTGTNPIAAILDADGVLELWGGEIYRDWFDLYAVSELGTDRGVSVRYGKNLSSFSGYESDEKVTTRIVPVGADFNGEPLFLPEIYVASQVENAYPFPRYHVLDVSDAKVSEDSSMTRAYETMREEANKELQNACDLPEVSVSAGYVELHDTEEFKRVAAELIFLGDTLHIHQTRLQYEASIRMVGYKADCVLRRYTSMTLGANPEDASSTAIALRRLKKRLGNEEIKRNKQGEPKQYKTVTPVATETSRWTGSAWVSAPDTVSVSATQGWRARARFAALSTLNADITDARTVAFVFRLTGVQLRDGATCSVYLTTDASATSGTEVVSGWKITGSADTVLTCDLTPHIDAIVAYTTNWYVIVAATSGMLALAGKDAAHAPYARITHNVPAGESSSTGTSADVDDAIDAKLETALADGGSIDTAIDDAITAALSVNGAIGLNIETRIGTELSPGGSIDSAIDGKLTAALADGGSIDTAIDAAAEQAVSDAGALDTALQSTLTGAIATAKSQAVSTAGTNADTKIANALATKFARGTYTLEAGTWSASAFVEYAVSFGKTLSAAPTVVATLRGLTGATLQQVLYTVKSPTATGFTLRMVVRSACTLPVLYIDYIACCI